MTGFSNDEAHYINSMHQQHADAQEEEDFWFSRKNQKRHVFEFAKELYLQGDEDYTPEDAIKCSQEFIDAFHSQIIKFRK